MLTDTDIDKLEKRFRSVFFTKEDIVGIKGEINNLQYQIDKMGTMLGSRIDLLENKVDIFRREFNDFKDNIYTHLDGFAGANERIDNENTSLSERYAEIDKRISELTKSS